MNKFYITLFALLCSANFYAQNIAGYVIQKNATLSERKVYLSQLISDTIHSEEFFKIIATAVIDNDGYFSIDNELPQGKHIYKIFIKKNQDTLTHNKDLGFEQLFILSNTDTLFFKKSTIPFSDYKNTSKADKEWQRLKLFESNVYTEKKYQTLEDSNQYLNLMRIYAKDSLKILTVKLISIKELNNKDLLDKDIALNSDFYLDLLKELKSSEIHSREYLFLENKLTLFLKENIQKKYTSSKWVISFLSLAILALLFFIYRLKGQKNKLSPTTLSRQELNIRNLILEGKSNKEIAKELFISLSTVKTHITNIYYKLKVSNRNELSLKFKNSTGTST